MVQFTHDAGSGGGQAECAPALVFVQPHIASLEQIAHTQLTHLTQQSVPSQSLSEPVSQHSMPQFYHGSSSEVNFDSFPASGQLVDSSLGLGLDVPVEDSSFQSTQFSAFGSTVNIPSTRLDSGLISSESSPEFERLSGDVTTDVSRTFEVVPVTEAECYSEMDNTQQQKDCLIVDNSNSSSSSTLQKDTRVYSVDSLNESKGYSSDSSSDVYMNSDYTDTVSSADSSAFLLAAANYNNDNNTETAPCPTQVALPAEESSQVTTTYYSNEAFSDTSKELISWSSEESDQEKVEEEHGDKAGEITSWVVTIPDEEEEEDSGMLADKEDDEDDVEHKGLLIPPQEDSALENLVQRLADQHPSEMVDITVQVLDGPVYESLTEPIQEESWLQSTESLHLYKMLKQGRSNTMNSLRAHAINHLRANTMNNLHERSSFLNLTAASVTNLGHACQKALTYVRADMEFGSMMSLKDNLKHSPALAPGKGRPPSDTETLSPELSKKGEPSVASGRHTRNVLFMALIVTILLISVMATRNLQSSLNQEGGVGIICLAVMFASYMLGSLLSPVLVQGVGVKGCITGGLVLQLLYVAANLHPVMWLMLPASVGGGASLALIWNAMSTYIVLLARGESDSKQKSYERVADKYFGIFCLIYQSNLIIGNLIASLVLTFGDGAASSAAVLPVNSTSFLNATAANLSAPYLADSAIDNLSPLRVLASDLLGMAVEGEGGVANSTSASTAFDATTDSYYHLCGAEYCHHFVVNQESSQVSDRTIYLLFGIFIFLVAVTIVMAAFLLEPLSPHVFSSSSSSSGSAWHSVKRQIVSLVKFSRNVKFLLLLPLMLYSVMQFSFVCSEVMMAYVTCPVGVWLVGYTMMGYGVCCSVSSYATQALVPRTGRGFFIALATALNVGLLVFMRVWQPHPDSVMPLFVITSLFGFADGIWNVNANGLCGSVFPDHFEEAFTGLRVAQGLGGAFTMAYAPAFCMAVKIYIMIGVVLVVLVGYVGAEVLIRREKRKNTVLFEKEIV